MPSAGRQSTSDLDAFLGHDLDHLAHVVEILLVCLETLEHGLDAARLPDHHVTAKLTVRCGGVDRSSLDLIRATSTYNCGLTVDIQVQLTFQHQICLVPVMSVGRLANTTRGSELGNAVLAIGLLSGEAKGDGITENVANLGLLLKQSDHVGGHPKDTGTLADFLLYWLVCRYSHTVSYVMATAVAASAGDAL